MKLLLQGVYLVSVILRQSGKTMPQCCVYLLLSTDMRPETKISNKLKKTKTFPVTEKKNFTYYFKCVKQRGNKEQLSEVKT